MKYFLQTKTTKIIDKSGKPLHLRGVNLGGWLMMEGYILHAANVAVQVFKKKFAQCLGKKTLQDFEEQFSKHFIQEQDIRAISRLGFNCIRVPFKYGLIEKEPYKYSRKGVSYLDNVIRWAKKYKLYVILDLHGACGAQNHDWHSDSLGKAELWAKASYRKRTYALWEYLADRYKDESTIAGYDLLNEAVINDSKKLNSFYQKLIKTIRGIDKNHILFVEGNHWAQDIACLDRFDDDNLVLSIHYYEPLDFTFNFVPHLRYPMKTKKGIIGKTSIQKRLDAYRKEAKKRQRPVFVGEFGVNYREGVYGEDRWLRDVVTSFNQFGFHWTYWTFKAIKNSVFPDGLYSYFPNTPWVNRHGPKTGWDTYVDHWPIKRKDITQSWQTKNFEENTLLLKILRDAVK